MRAFDFAFLIRSILWPKAKLDLAAIERRGLLAVKIAQMYSMRPDLVAPAKCVQLAKLLQQTTPLSPQAFHRRWREVATRAFEELRPSLSAQPIASASLGQAHLATLRDGRRVVVKLSRAEMEKTFAGDIRRLRRWLVTAVTVYPALERLADPLRTLADVERQTLREMNFLAEPIGAARLAALAEDENFALRFPNYHLELSSDRFLVSDFIEGPTLGELLERGALGYDALLELFRIHGFFLFIRGEFHGDLHPGNVIYREGTFWFLDNANVETIPSAFSRGLFLMLGLIAEDDLDRAAETLAGLSIEPMSKSKLAEFRRDFRALYANFVGKSVGEASLTTQMMETVKLAVKSGMTFPSGAFPLVKSLMYLDGMVLRAAPQANLLRDVAKFAGEFLD